jgi:hypothetical protein
MSSITLRCLLAAGALATASTTWAADAPKITPETLVDRAMIEDLLVDYYSQLGAGKHDFSYWFAADGILDVNGEIGQGKEGIEKIYRDTAARASDRKGTFRMILSNLKISVNGSTATADMIWTGVLSETVTAKPVLDEQGHEHDELVKQNGRWVFKHRWVTSDGGMNAALLKTYKKR